MSSNAVIALLLALSVCNTPDLSEQRYCLWFGSLWVCSGTSSSPPPITMETTCYCITGNGTTVVRAPIKEPPASTISNLGIWAILLICLETAGVCLVLWRRYFHQIASLPAISDGSTTVGPGDSVKLIDFIKTLIIPRLPAHLGVTTTHYAAAYFVMGAPTHTRKRHK